MFVSVWPPYRSLFCVPQSEYQEPGIRSWGESEGLTRPYEWCRLSMAAESVQSHSYSLSELINYFHSMKQTRKIRWWKHIFISLLRMCLKSPLNLVYKLSMFSLPQTSYSDRKNSKLLKWIIGSKAPARHGKQTFSGRRTLNGGQSHLSKQLDGLQDQTGASGISIISTSGIYNNVFQFGTKRGEIGKCHLGYDACLPLEWY